MILTIPRFTAIRYMVYEMGNPLRGFETKAEAERFASKDKDLEIRQIPKAYKQIEVEEAPF